MTTAYETKGVSACDTLVGCVAIRLGLRASLKVYITQRVCQPFRRKSGKVPSIFLLEMCHTRYMIAASDLGWLVVFISLVRVNTC